MLASLPARISGSTLAVLGGMHLCWARSPRSNLKALVPTSNMNKPLFIPSAFACNAVGAGLIGMSAILFLCGAQAPKIIRQLARLISAIFLLRAVGDFCYIGFFKRHKRSQFAKLDSLVYSPLCTTLSVLSLLSSFQCNGKKC